MPTWSYELVAARLKQERRDVRVFSERLHQARRLERFAQPAVAHTSQCELRMLAQGGHLEIETRATVGDGVVGVVEGEVRIEARLTSRELAVLRMVSAGGQTRDIAQALGLGEETIRSHLKKAQAKLGVRNRTHAACEALRHNLIP